MGSRRINWERCSWVFCPRSTVRGPRSDTVQCTVLGARCSFHPLTLTILGRLGARNTRVRAVGWCCLRPVGTAVCNGEPDKSGCPSPRAQHIAHCCDDANGDDAHGDDANITLSDTWSDSTLPTAKRAHHARARRPQPCPQRRELSAWRYGLRTYP